MKVLLNVSLALMIIWINQAAKDPFSQYEEILNSRVGSSPAGSEEVSVSKNTRPEEKSELKLGTCDLSLIFLLHPRMRDYNFLVQSFRAPLPEKLSVPAEFYMRQRNAKRIAFLKQLDTREALFEESQQRLASAISQLRQNFEREISELKSEPGAIRKIEVAEDRYFKERMELEEEIQNSIADHKKWKADNTVEIYVSEGQRNQIFRLISKEIQESLQSISKSAGIDLIFNKSLKRVRAVANSPDKSFDYTSLANYENHFAMLMNRPMTVGEGNAALSTRGLFRSVAPYFANYEEIFQYFEPVLSQHLFLGQGEDLTVQSLKLLWESYQIPETKLSAMLEVVKNWTRD